MSFLHHLKFVLRILFIFSLRPFIYSEKQNQIKCNLASTIYIAIFIFIFSFFIALLSYYGFFENDFAARISGTYNITETLQISLITFIYYATAIVAIRQRHEHAKLLNAISTVDQKLIACENITNQQQHQQEQQYESFRRSIGTICTFFVTNVLGYFIWQQNKTIIRAIFYALYTWQMTTLVFTTVYMRYLGVLLLNRFRRVGVMFRWEINHVDLKKWKSQRMAMLFNLFEELNCCKKQYGRTFGLQFLLNSVFDLILLTVGGYTTSLVIWRRGLLFSEFSYIVFYLMPHVLKNIFLIYVVDGLANQVSDGAVDIWWIWWILKQ